MLEVARSRADTFTQSITPLIHCSVNNALIKVTPVFNQSFFQKIFDVINVLVSATSTSARLAVCRSSRAKLSIMYMYSRYFTEARDSLFLGKSATNL